MILRKKKKRFLGHKQKSAWEYIVLNQYGKEIGRTDSPKKAEICADSYRYVTNNRIATVILRVRA